MKHTPQLLVIDMGDAKQETKGVIGPHLEDHPILVVRPIPSTPVVTPC